MTALRNPSMVEYSLATVNFGTITGTLPAGTEIKLRFVAPDSITTTDLFLAYDAPGFQAKLIIE